MINWVLYFFAAFGLAYIVGHSKISVWPRRFLGGYKKTIAVGIGFAEHPVAGKLGRPGEILCMLLECPACFGFWEGWFATVLFIAPPIAMPYWLWTLVLGCATSGVNLVLSKYTGLLE